MALKVPDLGQIPKFGTTGQTISNRKCHKGNAIYRTAQCDVTIFFNASHNNKILQHLQIAAIRSHYVGGHIMLQMAVKYFNFLITVIYSKSIELETFVCL